MMNCDSPYRVNTGEQYINVPCGRCPLCKRRRVNSWVYRLQKEDERSSSAHFVTLTYNNDFISITPNGFMTLVKRDFQLFMKRLRKLSLNKLKYYAVGEYGDKTWRPHYHFILFNLEDIDYITHAWKDNEGNSIGQVHFGDVSSNSIAYTCKYIDKAARVPVHDRDDRVPEFSLMSKGIGSNYLTASMINYHNADFSRSFITMRGGYRIALPRYYRDKIFDEYTRDSMLPMIRTAVSDAAAAKRTEFFMKFPTATDDDYDAHLESERIGRYNKFYSRSKKPRS